MISSSAQGWVLHIVFKVLSLILMTGILVHGTQVKLILFILHPGFMTMALFGCTQAILLKHTFPFLSLPTLLTSGPGLSQTPRRLMNFSRFKFVHGLVQVLSFLAILLGILSIYLYRLGAGKSHWNSLHSWFGILTVLLLLVAVGVRIAMDRLQPHSLWKTRLYLIHIYGGYVAFFSLVLTTLLGYQTSGWFRREYSFPLRVVTLLVSSLHFLVPAIVCVRYLVSYLSDVRSLSDISVSYESLQDETDNDVEEATAE